MRVDENHGITFETNHFMNFKTKPFDTPTFSKEDYDRFFKIYVTSDEKKDRINRWMKLIVGNPKTVMIIPKENPMLGLQREIIGYRYADGKPVYKENNHE